MNDNGQINFPNFKTLIERQNNAGNGVLILGSTGEGLALSIEEQKEVVRFVATIELNVPVMVGVPGYNLIQTQEWLAFCEEFDYIDSYLMPVPLYAKPGPEGQYQWFTALLNAVKKPCMLYNVPSRTGAKLSFETAKRLQSHKNFWALKEASGSIEDFKTFCSVLPEIEVFSGEDALIPAYVYYGCKGLVSVMSNVWPEATNLFVNRCLNFEQQGLNPTWDIAANSLFVASNPVPTKAILAAKGFINTPTLRAPLTAHDMTDMSVVLQADQLVTHWFEQAKNETQGALNA